VNDKITDRGCRQAHRIGQGSPLVTSIALASIQLRKMHTHLPKEFRYRSHEEFFLKHGRLYHPRKFPAKFRLLKGPPKACLYNAILLALCHPELDYVEGYALHADARLNHPIEHAWCVDAKGNVIDPTWHEEVAREYFGLALDKWAMNEQHKKGEPFGLMFNWKLLQDVMCGKAKDWRTMLAKRKDAAVAKSTVT
jgi:hypothetical protein